MGANMARRLADLGYPVAAVYDQHESTAASLAVTAAVERDRGNDSPAAFAGLIHRSPWQAVALLVFLLSLAGIPPLAGFVGKFAMFSAAMAESTTRGTPGLTWLVGLAAVMSAI